MNNNTSYETQAIDLSLLSVLDITKEGKVVSVEKWVELWTLVFQHINKIDAFCVDMQATLDNWHASEVALNEIIKDIQMKYASLSTGFTHYGEAPPQNPHINFWVRRMEDIAPHCFLTNADIDILFNPESENAQSGIAVAEGLSKLSLEVSRIHVGTEKPTDGNANVWINPEGVTNEPLTVEVVKNDNGHTVTITDANNTNTFEVLNGKEGTQGIQGEKGEKGDKGDSGPQGEKGADGYTPQKDVDYWNAEDKAQIVKEVLDSVVIQQPEAHVIYGDVDSQNNITIYGNLPNGTYSLKFEYEDGTTTDIGNIVIGDNSITPITKDIPLTWIRDIKIDKTTGAETTDTNYNASDYVEVEEGYTYIFEQRLGGYGAIQICFYDTNKNFLGWEDGWGLDVSSNTSLSHTIKMKDGTAYIRIRQYDSAADPEISFYPQHYVLTATNAV